MTRLGSIQREYDFYVSCDPAFAPPPSLADNATDEDKEAFLKAAQEYMAKWKAARETTNYTPLVLDGKTPIKFVLGPVKSKCWRAAQDRGRLPPESPKYIGQAQLFSLLTRLSVRAVPALDMKITHSPDPEWDDWEMAPAELVDVLDEQNTSIVSEIGTEVLRRLTQGAPTGSGPLF